MYVLLIRLLTVTATFIYPSVGPPLVFPFLYSSYAEQQYDEVLKLFNFATKMTVPVLMGDFNHGPAAPGGIMWDLPLHYGLMNAQGFYSPYVLRDGRCTLCVENAQAVFPASFIVDHIYTTTNTMDRVRSVEVHALCGMHMVHGPVCPYITRSHPGFWVHIEQNCSDVLVMCTSVHFGKVQVKLLLAMKGCQEQCM